MGIPPRDYKEWLYDLLRKEIDGLKWGQKVTKIVIGEDINGEVREIEYYDGNTPLFKLIKTNASSVTTSWCIERIET